MGEKQGHTLFKYEACRCGWKYLPAPGGGGFCRWCNADLSTAISRATGEDSPANIQNQEHRS